MYTRSIYEYIYMYQLICTSEISSFISDGQDTGAVRYEGQFIVLDTVYCVRTHNIIQVHTTIHTSIYLVLRNFLLTLVPCSLLLVFRFSFLSFLIFSPCIPVQYDYLLRVPSSVQQLSATLRKYVFYSTCSCVICILPRNSFVFTCLLLLFLGWRFFLLCSHTRYAST